MGWRLSWIVYLVFMTIPKLAESAIDCSVYSRSCETCISVYPKCMWCSVQGNAQCVTYFSENICDYEISKCPRQQENKYNTLLELLNTLKEKNTIKKPVPETNGLSQSDASTVELKELLHKLLLLKLLRKVKNEGSSSLSAEDRQLLNEYSSSLLPMTTVTTTTTTTTPVYQLFTDNKDMNAELARLLTLLKSETNKKAKEVLSKIVNPTSEPIMTGPKKTPINKNISQKIIDQQANSTNVSAINHIELSNVNYEEVTDQSIFELNKLFETTSKTHLTEKISTKHIIEKTTVTVSKTSTSASSSMAPPTTNPINSYCHVYEHSEFCNNDNNCTWCNTRDQCIARIDREYKDCAANKKLDDKFGLDQCLAFKGCKSCVSDPKCYWCGVSSSCHSYPFFGFIPESCASEFFVKQCDVQLAVVIIVLPLIIILLAMVTFYFCLKYCYYRRKVLRVPLFERPGVFDYRKDKKVYFVNPEDEDDSADEMQVENLRKKYRLSADKAPLIDPNS